MRPERAAPDAARLDEAALVVRAQLGDRGAIERLLTLTSPWLNGFLRRLMGDAHAAEDACQDVLLIVCRKLGWLSDPRAYRAWVYRTAARHALSQLRKQRRRRALESRAAASSTDAGSGAAARADPEDVSRVNEEIERLSPNTRAVVVLHYHEGLSIAHVAAVLGLREGTAKSRLAAGLAALRRALPEFDA